MVHFYYKILPAITFWPQFLPDIEKGWALAALGHPFIS
jgi:hypothetical protein